ncbi:hypothetical protein LMG1866_03755 [Achromobacter ruhlandii]|nr:hypothetical protein LMG1866_03755 [Achromobacter ruhlandii]CUJ41386.1 Uncharacterised protein [Achromobacter xylosoxidans]
MSTWTYKTNKSFCTDVKKQWIGSLTIFAPDGSNDGPRYTTEGYATEAEADRAAADLGQTETDKRNANPGLYPAKVKGKPF